MFNTVDRYAHQYTHGLASGLTPLESRALLQWLNLSYEAIAPQVRYTDWDVSPDVFVSHWETYGELLISRANSDHPFFTVADNCRFRAVHDMHHILTGCRFDWEGELATYQYAAQFAPRPILWILRSEILGQAAVAITTGAFPEQKLVRTCVG